MQAVFLTNMICKIAEILTEVPTADGLYDRCRDYLWNDGGTPEIIIREDAYRTGRYDARLGSATVAYMESAYQFYRKLVELGGFYLHSSAVVMDGKAYLFSGPCGVGKSTHTQLWTTTFGSKALIINDDKPAIRYMNGQWIAYGTPWCGKNGINANASAPLAGVCFLKKSKENRIRRLDAMDAMQRILSQTIYKFDYAEQLDCLLGLMNRFIAEIPVYELENRPEEAAAQLSHEIMRQGAEEIGL